MFKHKEPRTLIESVKKSVIGQDTAITDLGNFIFNYILFQYSQYSNIKLVDRPITLLVGASGSGKTFMVKTIAEEMKFNFLEINAKSISQEGWHGKSFEDLILSGLARLNIKNTEADPWTIIFIDEFDKLCLPLSSSNSDIYNVHLQNSLLKYFENITLKRNEDLDINTSHLCFILAGNFQELRDKRQGKNIGFIDKTKERKVLTQELEEFGVIPEILGRISHYTELNELTTNDYCNILSSEQFEYSKYMRLFTNLGFGGLPSSSQQTILDIVNNADTERLGVRAVIQEVNVLVSDLLTKNSDKLVKITDYYTYLNNGIALFEEKLKQYRR